MTTPQEPNNYSAPYGNSYPPAPGGYGQPGPDFNPAPPRPVSNTPASISLVVGIVSIFGIFFAPVGAIVGLVAIALGIFGLIRAGSLPTGYRRRVAAITGMILGAIALVASISIMVFFNNLTKDLQQSFDELKSQNGEYFQCDPTEDDPQSYTDCLNDTLSDEDRELLNKLDLCPDPSVYPEAYSKCINDIVQSYPGVHISNVDDAGSANPDVETD